MSFERAKKVARPATGFLYWLLLAGLVWWSCLTPLGSYMQVSPLGMVFFPAYVLPGSLLTLQLLIGVAYWVSLCIALQGSSRDRVMSHLWVLPLVLLGPWLAQFMFFSLLCPPMLVFVWNRDPGPALRARDFIVHGVVSGVLCALGMLLSVFLIGFT